MMHEISAEDVSRANAAWKAAENRTALAKGTAETAHSKYLAVLNESEYLYRVFVAVKRDFERRTTEGKEG